MQLVPSLLFGVSASLDALLVGVSYGLRGVHVRLLQNLFISLVALLGTCLSVGFGGFLAPLLPSLISRLAGSMILMFLGFYYIVKWTLTFLKNRTPEIKTNPETSALISAERPPGRLTASEVLLLSITLSANNLGIGLSASIAGLTLIPAATATCICSILFLYLGNNLGRSRLMRLIGGLADPISGMLLISLGLIQYFL